MIITFLLIAHGLCAVALLGALSHQVLPPLLGKLQTDGGFWAGYSRVAKPKFVTAVVWLYVLSFILGALIYPAYRVDVRIPFEEMGLRWAVGVFEIKEHFGGLGIGMLPAYWMAWKGNAPVFAQARSIITASLAFIVWFDFLAGHVLNNIRGLF